MIPLHSYRGKCPQAGCARAGFQIAFCPYAPPELINDGPQMKSVKLQWIKRERQRLGIQMHANEIFFIARAIRPPVNFLIFGMGNDSPFWFELNHRGRTVFVEDQEEWFRRTRGENPFLEAYLVKCRTTLTEAMQLIDCPARLALDLPPEIRKTEWDAILIDGPAGYEDNTRGRMKSI